MNIVVLIVSIIASAIVGVLVEKAFKSSPIRRRLAIIAGIIAFAIVAAAPSFLFKSDDNLYLRVVVTDLTSGTPISKAKVVISIEETENKTFEASTVSNGQARVAFSAEYVGRPATLTVSGAGFEPNVQLISLTRESPELPIALIRASNPTTPSQEASTQQIPTATSTQSVQTLTPAVPSLEAITSTVVLPSPGALPNATPSTGPKPTTTLSAEDEASIQSQWDTYDTATTGEDRDWQAALAALNMITRIVGSNPTAVLFPAARFDQRTASIYTIRAQTYTQYAQALQADGELQQAQEQYTLALQYDQIDEVTRQQTIAAQEYLTQARQIWVDLDQAWAEEEWSSVAEYLQQLRDLPGFGELSRDPWDGYTIADLVDVVNAASRRNLSIPQLSLPRSALSGITIPNLSIPVPNPPRIPLPRSPFP